MPKPRAILKRAISVKNVAKITNTMQMIATAKFKRAHDRAVAARPYTDHLGRIIAEVAAAAGEYHHPLMEVRPARRATVLAVGGNRGLCGPYNGGVVRALLPFLQDLKARGIETELVVSGKKIGTMLRYQQVPVAKLHTRFEDKPAFADVLEAAAPLLERFATGAADEVHLVYTKFLSSARQQAVVERVLPLAPLPAGKGTAEPGKVLRDWLFSPDAATILSDLIPRSVRLKVFQAFLDAAVSEQTARMVAMKAATDNAQDVIRDLTQLYNRSRQSLITTELSEIIGGAAALE
jgi:F-type H+-transporting ATPase subunit gamma